MVVPAQKEKPKEEKEDNLLVEDSLVTIQGEIEDEVSQPSEPRRRQGVEDGKNIVSIGKKETKTFNQVITTIYGDKLGQEVMNILNDKDMSVADKFEKLYNKFSSNHYTPEAAARNAYLVLFYYNVFKGGKLSNAEAKMVKKGFNNLQELKGDDFYTWTETSAQYLFSADKRGSKMFFDTLHEIRNNLHGEKKALFERAVSYNKFFKGESSKKETEFRVSALNLRAKGKRTAAPDKTLLVHVEIGGDRKFSKILLSFDVAVGASQNVSPSEAIALSLTGNAPFIITYEDEFGRKVTKSFTWNFLGKFRDMEENMGQGEKYRLSNEAMDESFAQSTDEIAKLNLPKKYRKMLVGGLLVTFKSYLVQEKGMTEEEADAFINNYIMRNKKQLRKLGLTDKDINDLLNLVKSFHPPTRQQLYQSYYEELFKNTQPTLEKVKRSAENYARFVGTIKREIQAKDLKREEVVQILDKIDNYEGALVAMIEYVKKKALEDEEWKKFWERYGDELMGMVKELKTARATLIKRVGQA